MGQVTSAGPGRAVVAVYAILALAAVGRSGYQLITRVHEAPLAYVLSAIAAVVYCVATFALALNRRTLAAVSITFEFIGVITVGAWSVLDPAAFPDATVWSGFGAGYVWVPLVLPVLGMWWLRVSARRP